VLVAAFGAQDAETLQASAQIGSGLPVFVGQREAELSIGEAELKVADHLRVREAAASQIP